MAGNIPYIGSKISLITTSDIRYEGILYTLNREESTIAVQNVRSFGTEGRRCPEVPMSNEIYDFIIFRGKDLKDLTVLQGAPEPPQQYVSQNAGGTDYGDSHMSSNYNHAVPPADHNSMGSYGRQSPSTASSRNGYPQTAQSTNLGSYGSPYVGQSTSSYPNPVSSASRPSDRAYSGGMQSRESMRSYTSTNMHDDLSPPPARQPLYEEGNGVAPPRVSSMDSSKTAPPRQVTAEQDRKGGRGGMTVDGDMTGDQKARGRGKGGSQKKTLYEVLRFHKRAEELLVKTMRTQNSANIGPGELRSMSEMNPIVYHFYIDFVNYCCPSHTVQSDEQQWDSLSKALKKHFEKDFGTATQPQKPAQPQRPNNTLGDFITIETAKSTKKNAKVSTRGGLPRGGRGTGRGEKKELGHGSGDWDGAGDLDETSTQSSTWVCPRCTLRNENLLLECAACGTSKQQAALWAEFPPLG